MLPETLTIPGDYRSLGIALNCGQAFSWRIHKEFAYGVIQGKPCFIQWNPSNLYVKYTGDPQFIRRYFRTSCNDWFKAVEYVRNNQLNPFYDTLLENLPGMLIFEQDLWEVCLAFILSQNNSVLRITRSLNLLANSTGTLETVGVHQLSALPTPEQLLQASDEQLALCGVGYRLIYLKQLASRLTSNPNYLEELRSLTTETLLSTLMSWSGVGIKVASCIALYGYARHELFPVDVWIARALEQHFEGRNPAQELGTHSGLVQLCLYHYMRTHN